MRAAALAVALVLTISVAPLAAGAEQPKTPRIAFLLMGSPQAGLKPAFKAFREGLCELADLKDVPIRAAAIGAGALLVTHNARHFRSGEGVRVVRPRTLIEEALVWMGSFGR